MKLKHDKQWKPGQSGNPSGRAPLTPAERKAREMLRAASPLAVATLIKAMNEGGPEGLKAAVAVLNKLWPSGVDLTISGPDGGPIELRQVDPRHLTQEQLDALTAALAIGASQQDQDE